MSISWKAAATEIEFLPEHGRVVQITVAGHKVLWTPKEIEVPWNVGGDRMWVSPEKAWFFKDPKSFAEGHEVPQSLDPGTWALTRKDGNFVEMAQDVTLSHLHDKTTLDLHLERSFESVTPLYVGDGIQAVSYLSRASLELLGGNSDEHVGLWRLFQVPPGGVAHIPIDDTASRPGLALYRDYFEPAPPSLLETTQGEIRLRITGDRRCKIGVSPMLSAGQIVYTRKVEDGIVVLIISFETNPGEVYADKPIGEEGSNGDAVQVYNDDGSHGGFGEVEYHTPAVSLENSKTIEDKAAITAAHFTKDAWQEYGSGISPIFNEKVVE